MMAWPGGWEFERSEGGGEVVIRKRNTDFVDSGVVAEVAIPLKAWGDILEELAYIVEEDGPPFSVTDVHPNARA